VRSLALMLFNLLVYGGLVLAGWSAAGGLHGYFDNPARSAFLGLLFLQEAAAAWVRWQIPVPAAPPRPRWFEEISAENWRFLNQDMIYALAPFSDRQGIVVLGESVALRMAALVLFCAAAAWMLWALVTRRRHLQAMPQDGREPLLVETGPYRKIRHPLFLAVIVNSLAAALVFRSGGGLFLLFLMLATVLRRMRWIESDASRAVPLQWSAYVRSSRKLIPGIY